MEQMTEERAKQILRSRIVAQGPGKYRTKVTNCTPYTREDGQFIVITNYNLMTPWHLAEAKKLIAEGKLQEALNQRVSSSQRVSDAGEPIDYIPVKGEIVDVVLDNVTTNNDVTGLFAVSISPVPLTASTKVNVNILFGEEEEEGSESLSEAEETEEVEPAEALK